MARNGNNADQAARNLERVVLAGIRGGERALARLGDRIVDDIRASLSSPAAPSAPGTPPARRSGMLLLSYRSDMSRDVAGRRKVVISSTSPTGEPVAAYQEFGTSTAPARPHLRPAVYRALPTVGPEVARGMHEGERDAARRSRRGR